MTITERVKSVLAVLAKHPEGLSTVDLTRALKASEYESLSSSQVSNLVFYMREDELLESSSDPVKTHHLTSKGIIAHYFTTQGITITIPKEQSIQDRWSKYITQAEESAMDLHFSSEQWLGFLAQMEIEEMTEKTTQPDPEWLQEIKEIRDAERTKAEILKEDETPDITEPMKSFKDAGGEGGAEDAEIVSAPIDDDFLRTILKGYVPESSEILIFDDKTPVLRAYIELGRVIRTDLLKKSIADADAELKIATLNKLRELFNPDIAEILVSVIKDIEKLNKEG